MLRISLTEMSGTQSTRRINSIPNNVGSIMLGFMFFTVMRFDILLGYQVHHTVERTILQYIHK